MIRSDAIWYDVIQVPCMPRLIPWYYTSMWHILQVYNMLYACIKYYASTSYIRFHKIVYNSMKFHTNPKTRYSYEIKWNPKTSFTILWSSGHFWVSFTSHINLCEHYQVVRYCVGRVWKYKPINGLSADLFGVIRRVVSLWSHGVL